MLKHQLTSASPSLAARELHSPQKLATRANQSGGQMLEQEHQTHLEASCIYFLFKRFKTQFLQFEQWPEGSNNSLVKNEMAKVAIIE